MRRTGGPSSNRGGGRPPRTIWSQLAGGSRAFFKRVASLPRGVLIGAAALLFLVILTMVVDSALYYNKVHAGVNMAQQGLGGSTYDQAMALVNKNAEEFQDQPITLLSGTRTWTVTPEELGRLVDVDGSVNAAMQVTRESNLIADLARRLKLYFGGNDYPLLGQVDEEAVEAFLAVVAKDLDVKPTNQGLSIQGDTIEPTQGRSGFVVDQDTLRARLMDALFSHSTTQIQVPMMAKAPEVVADSSEEAIATVRTMLSGDLTLTYLAPPVTTTVTTSTVGQTTATTDPKTTSTTVAQPTTTTTVVKTSAGDLTFVRKTKTFTPSEIKDLLDYRAEDRGGIKVLVPYVSAEKMRPFFSKIEGPMTVPAVDAKFATDGATCYVDPNSGKQGKGLDHEATAAALTAAALAAGSRTAEAKLKDIEPDFTREEAEAMGITTNLGEWTEYWDKGTDDREHNVRLATERVGNTFVAPGQEFDFIRTLGPRTKDAGFHMAPGIVDGALEDVYGGGICQVSTVLFSALLKSGVKITERWNHSIFIDHYPHGKDATITGGGEPKNLKFINDTPNYVWVYGSSDGVTTRFVIFGTSDGRKVTTLDVSQPYDVTERPDTFVTTFDDRLPWDSTTVVFNGQHQFKLKLTRVITWPNGSTTSEAWVSSWKMKDKVVAVPTSTTTTTVPKWPTTATTVAAPPGS